MDVVNWQLIAHTVEHCQFCDRCCITARESMNRDLSSIAYASKDAIRQVFFRKVAAVLMVLDFLYFTLIWFTSTTPWLSVGIAVLFPLINIPCLQWSLRTGGPAITWSLRLTVFIMLVLATVSGAESLAWIMAFSAIVATLVMVPGAIEKRALVLGLVVCACLGCWLAGSDRASLIIITITLVAFAVITERVVSLLMDQNSELLLVTQQLERSNEELAKASDQALGASRAKSRFLATMSHEIRTPMNGLLGILHLLGEHDQDDESQQLISNANLCGNGLMSILNDILDVSKIEAGEMSIQKIPTDVEALAQSCLATFGAQAKGKQLGLTVAMNCQQRWGLSDPGRLQQILFNLVGNALKFTTQGTVKVEFSDRDNRLNLRVVDTGIGIDVGSCESIFDPFSQVESTQTVISGTGLGLSLVRNFAELLGGAVTLDSEPGNGSCFGIDIAWPACKAIQQGVAKPVSLLSSQPLRVLVAEDNTINQLIISRFLKSLGHQVTMVADGVYTLDFEMDEQFDVVLMDCQMPKMGGVEATRLLRERGVRTPIFAVTASVLLSEQARCLEAGMDGVLIKPLTLEALRTVLDCLPATALP